MKKEVIFTPHAPAPIGPYSQAILVGETLYVSGQIALDSGSNELVVSDIEAETKKVMSNISAILKMANMSFDNVVKCSIFLDDMNDFSIVNDVYSSYFVESPPARETVEVSTLPKNVNVEISCVAVK